MVTVKPWPIADHEWVTHYRMSMARKHVPAIALDERERELLNAVRKAEVPAADLFGDAEELASEDAAELATVDEEVRTSLGGGLRPALREVGGTLVGIGAVSVLLLIIRSGWSVDIDTAQALVGASVLVVFVGWIVGRALFSAGRSVSAVGALVVAVALGLAGIAFADALGSGHVVAHDVPVPFLAMGMLAPGVAALVAAIRMPQQQLRKSWDDSTWFRRFRGGLRARLMPAATARDHVAEIKQTLAVEGTSAYSEFGHPLVLARDIAAADRSVRVRLWCVSVIAGAVVPLCLAVLVLANQSWGSLTVPATVALTLAAAVAFAHGWHGRPWARS